MFSVDTQTILSDMPRAEDMMSLHNLFLSTSFGIWVWEPQSNAFYFNAHYMNMLGYAPTAFPFCMTTWEQLVHPDDREQIVAALAKFMICSAQGDAFENRFRMRMASGEYLWILSKGFVLGRNTVVARIGGNEFAILLRGCPEATAKELIERIQEQLALHNATPGALPIYMSLGSVSTEVPVDSHKLLALADRDMLTNKQAFRSARLHSMKTWLERETGTSISVSDVRLA